MSQMGSFPKDPGENKDIWNRHLATVCGLLGTWAYHFFHPKKWQLQIGWIFLKASARPLNPQNFTHENVPSTQLISGVGEPENDGLVGRGFFFSRGVFSIPAVNLPGCCPYSVTLFPSTYVKACTNPVTPSHSQASPKRRRGDRPLRCSTQTVFASWSFVDVAATSGWDDSVDGLVDGLGGAQTTMVLNGVEKTPYKWPPKKWVSLGWNNRLGTGGPIFEGKFWRKQLMTPSPEVEPVGN